MGGGRRKRVSNLRREREGVKGLVPRQPSLTKDARTAFHTFEAFDKFVTRSCGRREERS